MQDLTPIPVLTGLSEQSPMTARGDVPFPQQVSDLGAKLLTPPARA
ncbi:MAG TPA: hypothetical protein VGV06_08045 [Methylomirabilota bacterium]|nr:hypothetical protein [Methylomirabilota bacterium]